MISDADVERALDYLRKADEAAQARAEREYLTEWLKSRRAELTLKASGTSMAEREAGALASAEYRSALDGYKVAVERDTWHRFKREAAQALIEAWRTQCSNERAERI